MKTLKISDALEAVLIESVIPSPELLNQVERFMKDNVQLGYATKEESIQDAMRSKMSPLSKNKAFHSDLNSDVGERE